MRLKASKMRGLQVMDHTVLEFLPPLPVSAEERAEYLAFAKAVAVEAGLTTLFSDRWVNDPHIPG